MPEGLLAERDTAQLATALRGFTVDAVHELVGPIGRAALDRGDLAGATRELRGTGPLETFTRLFLLGREVAEQEARTAFAPLPLEHAVGAGVVDCRAGAVRAAVEIRPYAQDGSDWWVVSDLGADVRPGPLPVDHVLGIGAASLTLAAATPRSPVGRALDVGTGCGVQALHLGTHAAEVVATDVSSRALQMAATTAALSGQQWDLRTGSMLDPVAGERFDLVVANPPFVVSAGDGGYDYRDSGLAGDAACAALTRGLPAVLNDGGTAQLLANWIMPADGAWQDRVAGWLSGSGCDAWIWQREIAEPGEYVTLWLRDAGEVPGTPRWTRRYDAWLDWFAAAGVVAVGMGLITMWRTGGTDPVIVCEDVPQAVEQPAGPHIAAWPGRQHWLRAHSDDALLAARLRAAPDLVRERADLLGRDGWATATTRLRQSHGLRWTLDTDDAMSALVAGCDGKTPLRTLVDLLAVALGRPAAEIADAALPVVRDLVSRGFLLPAEVDG